MHSSRMRTVRCSSHLGGGGEIVCPGGCLPAGGWGCLGFKEGVHFPPVDRQTSVKT